MEHDELIEDAFSLLETANGLEEKNPIEAATNYLQACYLMKRFLDKDGIDGNVRRLIGSKIYQYQKQSKLLLEQGKTDVTSSTTSGSLTRSNQQYPRSVVVPISPPSSVTTTTNRSRPRHAPSSQHQLHEITMVAGQANSILSNAIDLDEHFSTTTSNHMDQEERALVKQQYTKAAELYLESIKLAQNAGYKNDILAMLKRRLEGTLNRLEQLQQSNNGGLIPRQQHYQMRQRQSRSIAPSPEPPSSQNKLSEEEIHALITSSTVASGFFLPWSDEDAQKLNLQANKHTNRPQALFSDASKLKLNSKQLTRFYKWARAPSIFPSGSACMLKSSAMNPYSIVQRYVTDCSFIASLCICAAHERRFGRQRRLVTSLIYPQDERGMPILSPSGRYLVKLWLNGVARQVEIDDFLPIDKNGNLLCSHTQTRGELWVSLIEKAYMKLCGGYDFPGSNSGVDLFSLTGWIPERIFFPKPGQDTEEKLRDHETPSERVWQRVYGASAYGDCLITMSSSPDLSKQQADAVGLVTGHAYAVLRVVQVTSGSGQYVRLLQLKNPWAHDSWKGRYSSHDKQRWTPELCQQVGYSPQKARRYDDGIFWICWDDVLVYFQNVHLSWNPQLFSHRFTTHSLWPVNQGPAIDQYNVGDNPQYILEFPPSSQQSTIWILLSRHVTKQEQEGADVEDFLTVHLHKNANGQGRIWYPSSRTCVLNGAYTNNPHVLIRYDLGDEEDEDDQDSENKNRMNNTGYQSDHTNAKHKNANKYLSLVLSQYKKSHDLGYTLSCYCTSPFSFRRPEPNLPFRLLLTGEWTAASAGGPPQEISTFGQNPQWLVRLDRDTPVQLRLSAQKSMAINCMMVGAKKRIRTLKKEPSLDSGYYRRGFTVADTTMMPAGTYSLICSAFQPRLCGAFSLDIYAGSKIQVEAI